MNANNKRLIKQSTKAFYQEGKNTEDYSLYDFLHGYLYSRWPYLYIGVALGEHKLSRTLQPVFLSLRSWKPGAKPSLAMNAKKSSPIVGLALFLSSQRKFTFGSSGPVGT